MHVEHGAGEWPAAIDPAAQPRWPRRSLRGKALAAFVVALLLCSSAVVLAIGVSRAVTASGEHHDAVDRLGSARGRLNSLRVDLNAQLARATEVRRELRSQRHRLAYLRHESVTGFAAAALAGARRGSAAGGAAGERRGRLDAWAQRSSVASQGWYYVRVSWRNGLPFIADSYTIDASPAYAYWVEGGRAVKRDTAGP